MKSKESTNLELHARIAELEMLIKQTDVLFSIAEAGIKSTNLSELLNLIVENIAHGTSANRVSMIIVDLASQKINYFVRGGPGADNINLSVPYDELMEGLSGWAIQNKKSALSPKNKPDPRESAAAQHRRRETNCGSIIVTPIQQYDEILGTITIINNPKDRDFTARDLLLVEAAAGQAASAIVKANLIQELGQANRSLRDDARKLEEEIAERKQIEALLRASEDNFRSLIELAPDALLIVGNDGSITLTNHLCQKLFGYSQDELLNQSVEILLPNRFHEIHKEHRRLFYKNPKQRTMGAGKHMELIGVQKSGTEFPVEISLSPLSSAHGVGVMAAVRDVTERKMAETRQAILYETLRAVGKHLDVIGIAKSAVDSIAHLSPWTSVALSLLNSDGETWKTVAGAGRTVGVFGQSRSINQGVIGRAYRTGEIQHVPNISADPDYFRGTATHSQSELAIPIKHNNDILGVINIESDKSNDFNEQDISLAESLADVISLAMANAYQYAMTQLELHERKHTEEILRRQKDYLETLHQISLDLLNRRNVDDLLNAIINNATRLLDAPYGDLDIVEGDVMITKAYTANQNFEKGLRTPRGESGAASWQAYDTRQAVIIDDYATWPYRHPAFEVITIHATIILPLISGDQCLGVFSLARSEPNHPFTPDEVQLTTLFAQQAALALDNAQLHEALRQESIRDALTGLFNRRFMEEVLPKELSRVKRKSLPLAVVIFDLDHLKDINDTFGHGAGDDTLLNLSLLLKATIRAGDIACRYGGDEFIVILPETHLEDAYQRMEKFRKDIKQTTLHHEGTRLSPLSISVGIAEYPSHGTTREALLKAADQALYRAKKNGRDHVFKAE